MTLTPDPLPLLRREVGQLRQRETRRIFDQAVYVGTLGGSRESWVLPARDVPAVDHGVRTDVVSTLLESAATECAAAWLVRPGTPEAHDADLHWLAAADAAFAIHGLRLETFHAITRYGWRDVRTGESRHWKRLRL